MVSFINFKGLAAGILALLVAATPALAQDKPLEKMSVGMPPVYNAVGIYYAKELGYFEQQGLDVDVQIFRNGSEEIVPMLATGKLDAASTGLTAGLYNAINGGAGIILAADSGHHDSQKSERPIQMIAISKQLYTGTLTKEILKGKTFAVPTRGNAQEIFIDLFLKEYGLSIEDVNIVTVPFSGMVTALAGGSVFGAPLLEPYLTIAKRQGAAVGVKASDELYPRQQAAALMFSKTFMMGHRDRAVKFITAYLQGVRYYLAHHSSPADLDFLFKVTQKYIPLKDRSLLDEIGKPSLYPDGRLYRDSIKRDIQWFVDHKYIGRALALDGLVDDSLLDEALKALGSQPVPKEKPSLEQRVSNMNNDLRLAVLQPDKVVEHCGLKPGMSVLDIGAGSGLFTFRLAEALKGGGMVYATEVSDELVRSLQETAKAKGLGNVTVSKVDPDGLDPFYGRQAYDLVLLSGMYYHLDAPRDYFRQLYPFVKENGRVIIIQPTNEEFFVGQQFTSREMKLMSASCSGAVRGNPVCARLRPAAREYLSGWQSGEPSAEIREMLAADLNAMLIDTGLFGDLRSFYKAKGLGDPTSSAVARMSTRQDLFVKWLAVRLDEDNAFGRDIKSLSEDDQKMLNRLNGLCLRGVLNLDRTLDPVKNFYLSDIKAITREMTAAGYRLVRRDPFWTAYYFLEFAKDTSSVT